MTKEDVVRLDNAARAILKTLRHLVDHRQFELLHEQEHPFLVHQVHELAHHLTSYDALAEEVGGPPLATEISEPIPDERDFPEALLLTIYRRVMHRINGAQPVVREGIPVDVPEDTAAVAHLFDDYAKQRARTAGIARQNAHTTLRNLLMELGLQGMPHVTPPPHRIGRIKAVGTSIGVLNFAGMQPRNADGSTGSPPPPPLDTFLDQIESTLRAGAFGPALLAALVVPDACGAIEYPGAGNGRRYVDWYDRFVEAVVDETLTFGGAAAWRVRNGMIHEVGLRFTEFGYDRVIFLPPGDIEITAGFLQDMGDGQSAFALDLHQHVTRIIKGARAWLASIASDQEKQDRLRMLIQLRPDGLPPFFVGLPVIV